MDFFLYFLRHFHVSSRYWLIHDWGIIRSIPWTFNPLCIGIPTLMKPGNPTILGQNPRWSSNKVDTIHAQRSLTRNWRLIHGILALICENLSQETRKN